VGSLGTSRFILGAAPCAPTIPGWALGGVVHFWAQRPAPLQFLVERWEGLYTFGRSALRPHNSWLGIGGNVPLPKIKICGKGYADALFAGAGVVNPIVRYIGGIGLGDLEYPGAGFAHFAQFGIC